MSYKKVLTYENISKSYKNAKYGCKGTLTAKAQTLEKQLDQGKEMEFEKITKLYEGNPQQLGQPPLTFLRQVLACIVNTNLMEMNVYHQDVVNRAKSYFDSFPSIGVYPDTQGYMSVRENIANYMEKRDGVPCDKHFLFVTCGSVGAIRFIVKLLIAQEGVDGILIPVPSHPMFQSTVALEGGKSVGYHLDESNGWKINIDELEKQYEKATKEGIKLKGLVAINPNNPTGSVLSEANMKEVINFCIKHTLVLFADEVYQQNVYSKDRKFFSFKKVLMEMGEPANKQLELISSNSISKGIAGEGGFRGGYMELVNIEQEIIGQLQKLDAMVDPANGTGQVAIDLIMNPPSKENGCAQETIDQYNQEKEEIQQSLTQRAQIVYKYLNACKNITSTEICGSLYAFPQVKLSESVKKAAEQHKLTPDEFYCHDCLEKTGIAILPGKAFGQVEGTYHFRISILQYDPKHMEETMKAFQEFNDAFHQQYP